MPLYGNFARLEAAMNLGALPPLLGGGAFGKPSVAEGALPLLPVAAPNGAPVAFALSTVVPPANLAIDLISASAVKVAEILARASAVKKQQASAPGILPTGNVRDHSLHRATLAQLNVASIYPHAFFSAYA